MLAIGLNKVMIMRLVALSFFLTFHFLACILLDLYSIMSAKLSRSLLGHAFMHGVPRTIRSCLPHCARYLTGNQADAGCRLPNVFIEKKTILRSHTMAVPLYLASCLGLFKRNTIQM